MNSVSLVNACRNLFLVQPFLAHGILPTLRMEDIKIALAKRLHNQTKIHDSPAPEVLIREYINSYNLLAEYITGHNLEVLLSLDGHDLSRQPAGTSFIYPLPELGKTVQFSSASLNAKKKLFFNGSVPPRRLRLSSYLYYRGIVSYYHMMESVAWQKNRRPLIGQMAMQIGQLTADGFARIIVHIKNGERFGEVARKYRLLSGNVITALVKAQEKYDCRIGRFFIEKEILSEHEIRTLDQEMKEHNLRFRQ
ncbi:MAG: hypothetical protein JW863_19290 [Chitinispirillaceae bacterium]|nr:hypothetical protein [Chitinispirillaceae bacterium]